ncbi:two-component response regulator [Clostridium sp. CAG:967]|nr:two-component response regulator [Clostridium sp. CAG:967]
MQSVTLIIDKRRELSTKYKKLLESENNAVVITKNLISAMKLIQDKEPDLIIISDSIDSDLSDYCKKIRALTYNMRPIIVALSKSAELADRLAVLENGADDFISEPVNSEEFVMRMKAHLRRELESNMDAKRFLPGKNYSLRALKRIISENKFWAAMLISIENFQNYRETYTELASDKLIQTYCAIIRSALSEKDYFGSISDNEFLIITEGLKAEKIANYLTFAFDSVASKFYSQQDIRRGFMLMQGDEFAGRRSNFVHTTIGIISNEFIQYKDSAQLMNALIQIHNMADNSSKSNYLIERPRITAENAVNNNLNNKILIIEEDEAMTLLLTTILNLQGYEIEVIKDYSEFSGVIPSMIILDAGNLETLKGIKTCKDIRNNTAFDNTKIIVTSIYHDKELILSTGADLYIPKPYEISNLLKWVEKLIKN